MPKMRDTKATRVMPAFGSEDAKMASQEITEAKVASEISYDAAFWNQRSQNDAENYH